MRNFIVLICFITIPFYLKAQTTNEDSINTVIRQNEDSIKKLKKESANASKSLKLQKDSLKLYNKINEQREDLSKLEIRLSEQLVKAQADTEASQKAAKDNQENAASLLDDSQHKRKAKRAERSADNAQETAKDARNSNAKVKDLQGDIKSLKSRIDKNEKKLSELRNSISSTPS